MARWEYLLLEIDGHNRPLLGAQNMVVSTSDGRWHEERFPKDPMAVARPTLGKSAALGTRRATPQPKSVGPRITCHHSAWTRTFEAAVTTFEADA
jgi:hypothetical protein